MPVSGVDLAADLERVGHRQRVGMAGHRDHVLGPEDRRLLEDAAAHLGQRQAIARRIEAVGAAGVLDRLERHAAHARLLQREVDDPADLVVVQALLRA